MRFFWHVLSFKYPTEYFRKGLLDLMKLVSMIIPPQEACDTCPTLRNWRAYIPLRAVWCSAVLLKFKPYPYGKGPYLSAGRQVNLLQSTGYVLHQQV